MNNTGTNLLWYRQEASCWNEALPLGNGRIGAMIYGGVHCERLCLNEDTLWAGNPRHYPNPAAQAAYQKARELALSGDYRQAQQVLENDFTALWSQPYLCLGDLYLHLHHPGPVSDYSRSLSLSDAISRVSYRCAETEYIRECFISAPDQVLVFSLRANHPQSVSFDLLLSPAMRAQVEAWGSEITLEGVCPCCEWQYGERQIISRPLKYGDTPEEQGVQYRAQLRILPVGGTLTVSGGGISVQGADEALILLGVRTSFAGWNHHPVLEGKTYRKPCAEDVEKAAAMGYEALKARHLEDYCGLYRRVELDLGGGDEKLAPTDQRLFRHDEGGEDPALYALLFNYGRYLTLAASRPGTQAMNLQGIWNDRLDPPWNANYTININTEMNYWPTLRCNLPECCEPLNQLIAELAESGSRTALEYYGAPGWVSHHNTDLWRMSTPVGAHCQDSAVFSFWPMSSGWLIRHLWEYYEYTGDEAFLRKHASVILSAARFYLSVLSEDSRGYLIFAPSTSPENLFLLEDGPCPISATTTMTTAIIRDVFEIALKTASLTDDGSDLSARLSAALPRLRPFETGAEGELLEWSEELPENEIHHRHVSHLYGLHPASQITPEKNPEACQACRKTLSRRGDDGTGWSLGWKINFWARLRDGDHALKLLKRQLRPVASGGPVAYGGGGGTYLNLLDAHPPFQIDGNFGACAGICEMLLQFNENGDPLPLPALPAAWKSGFVRGLLGKGGRIIDMAWQDGKLTNLSIRSRDTI